MDDYGIKELYDVVLKTTYNIEIKEKIFEEGEIILRLDKIQLAALAEEKSHKSARGGYGNAELIPWDNTRDIQFNCTQGVVSQQGLAILSNSKIGVIQKNESILVQKTEIKTSDTSGIVQLSETPEGKIFIYKVSDNSKIALSDGSIIGKNVNIGLPSTDILVDYYFSYTNGGSNLIIGERLFNGYLILEGKLRLKDDTDGHDKTGLITIPRVKLMSDLSLRLGTNGSPTLSAFNFIGYPVGERNSQHVCNIVTLNDDIDSDF